MEGVEVEEFPPPVYVDGEAPDDGHAPTLPPKPTKPTPSETETESETPTADADADADSDADPDADARRRPRPCILLECPSESPTRVADREPHRLAERARRREAAREAWWAAALRW